MDGSFFGRTEELAWLRSQFDGCAARGADGRFGGPRMAVVLAESGVGKSRLVQELYRRLTADPAWDPPAVDYWPEAFGGTGEQLRVVPDMRGHVPKGPPRFAWLGARWQPTDVRNVQERRSVLPELRSSVLVHAEILKSHGSAWSDVAGRMKELVRDEGFGVAADVVGIPFFGLMTKLAKNTKDLITDRMAGPKRFDEVEAEEIKGEIDEALECVRLLLNGRGAVPTVLWLDDAQWIDAESLEFLHRLWAEAERARWPLLLVATHWEREWREMALRGGDSAGSLYAFAKRPGVEARRLGNAVTGELKAYLAARLPGLTPGQQSLLVGKAGGNFLTMVENVGELLRQPANFVGRDPAAALSPAGEKKVEKWESQREKRVEQRFGELQPEVQDLLGWSSHFGLRFLREVVEEFAAEAARLGDARELLDRCIDPYVILGPSGRHLREFRDRAFHMVAARHFENYSEEHREVLKEVLRRHLVEWVNNSFDAEGNDLWPDPRTGFEPPERSATSLEAPERHDLLDMAMRELPLPGDPDWSRPEDAAALRAIYLSIVGNRQEGAWDRVAGGVKALERVAWSAVPPRVLDFGNRGWLAGTSEIAGVLYVAETLYGHLLADLRGLADGLGTPESLRNLSIGLNNVAGIEEARGNLDGALARYRESLDIRRRLAERLGNPQSLRDLGFSLIYVAGIERARGDLATALARYRESLEIARRLTADLRSPDNLRDLSISLERVAGIEQARGDLAAASAMYRESLAIRRDLAERLGNPQSLREVSLSLTYVAGIEQARGDLDAASAMYRESLEISLRLVEELGTPQSLRDRSLGLDNVAGIERARGDLDTALARYLESLEIRRRLAEELGTPQSVRDVSVSLNNIAGIERARGDLDTALARYQESLDLRRRLADELRTPQSLRDVSVSLDKVAGIERIRGDFDAALTRYRESIDIGRKLADELGTPESLRDLCISLNNAAVVERARSDLAGALARSREIVDIRRRLATELGTPESLRELATSLEKVAEIERSRGDRDGALARYREIAATMRRLADELGTPASLRELGASLEKVAQIERDRGDLDAALATRLEIVGTVRRLAEKLGTPDGLREVSAGLDRVAGLHRERGDLDAAAASHRESLDLRRVLAAALGTPEAWSGATRTVHLTAACELDRGRPRDAHVLLEQGRREADLLADRCGDDLESLENLACYWETAATVAGDLGLAVEHADAAARAAEFRRRMADD